jgi:type I restriction enzyme M protein
MNDTGRAAVVLDTGAVTRGSGSKNEDKERNIRRWFVEQDLIEGVILLPDNLFYNTTAAGVIVVLNKRKPKARRGKIVLLNASKRFIKGRPKNYLPDADRKALAELFNRGEDVDGEVAIITREQAEQADFNLSPSRWVDNTVAGDTGDIGALTAALEALSADIRIADEAVFSMLRGVKP